MKPKRRSGVQKRLQQPMTTRGLELLVCLALFLWTFCQLVFVRSTIALIPRIANVGPTPYYQAVVIGCLIAVLASKETSLGLVDGIVVFYSLFTALSYCSRTGDVSLLILILIIVASSGMSYERLARTYLLAAIAALGTVTVLSLFSGVQNNYAIQGGHLVAACGFDSPQTLVYVVVSILSAFMLTAKGRGTRLALCGTSVLCSLFEALVLGNTPVAIVIILLPACQIAYLRLPDITVKLASYREIRIALGAFFILACCLAVDTKQYYDLSGLGITGGAYLHYAQNVGQGALACVAALIILTVWNLPRDGRFLATATVMVMYAVLLSLDVLPSYLELNCTLLLLGTGIGARHERRDPSESAAVSPTTNEEEHCG